MLSVVFPCHLLDQPRRACPQIVDLEQVFSSESMCGATFTNYIKGFSASSGELISHTTCRSTAEAFGSAAAGAGLQLLCLQLADLLGSYHYVVCIHTLQDYETP